MGSKLLKVVSILMIVFGAIGIVFDIIAVAGIAAVSAYLGSSIGMYWIALICAVIGTIVEFVAGIIGIRSWDKPEKAQTCVILGCICVGITVLSNILTLVSYSQGFNVFSLLTGLVIPVLFLIGAFQLKKQA